MNKIMGGIEFFSRSGGLPRGFVDKMGWSVGLKGTNHRFVGEVHENIRTLTNVCKFNNTSVRNRTTGISSYIVLRARIIIILCSVCFIISHIQNVSKFERPC